MHKNHQNAAPGSSFFSEENMKKNMSFVFAALAVLFVCLALFFWFAPMCFVNGTLRPDGTSYSREIIKLVGQSKYRLQSARIPAGTETVFNMNICDAHGNLVTTVGIPDTSEPKTEAIVYLPIWPSIYVTQAAYKYDNFALVATTCAVIGIFFCLAALHSKMKPKYPTLIQNEGDMMAEKSKARP